MVLYIILTLLLVGVLLLWISEKWRYNRIIEKHKELEFLAVTHRYYTEPHHQLTALNQLNASLFINDIQTSSNKLIAISHRMRKDLSWPKTTTVPIYDQVREIQTFVDDENQKSSKQVSLNVDIPEKILYEPLPRALLRLIVRQYLKGADIDTQYLNLGIKAQMEEKRATIYVSCSPKSYPLTALPAGIYYDAGLETLTKMKELFSGNYSPKLTITYNPDGDTIVSFQEKSRDSIFESTLKFYNKITTSSN
jgi:LytS/YehU family sensor histidine kinase